MNVSRIEFLKRYISFMFKPVQTMVVATLRKSCNCKFIWLQQMPYSLLHSPRTLNPAVLS